MSKLDIKVNNNMSSSNKSKDFDSRKRKFNENKESKIQNSSVTNKQNSRVLKPSSLTNLVEMVRKHTVYVPRGELPNGEVLEGPNFVKFLQEHLNIVETPKAQELLQVEKPELKPVSLKCNRSNETKEKTLLYPSRSPTPEPEKKFVQKRKANKELEELYVNNKVEYVVAQYDDKFESNIATSAIEQIELDQVKVAQNAETKDFTSKSESHEKMILSKIETLETHHIYNKIEPTGSERTSEKVAGSINLHDFQVLDECLCEEDLQGDHENIILPEKTKTMKEIEKSSVFENAQEFVGTKQKEKVQETNENGKVHEISENHVVSESIGFCKVQESKEKDKVTESNENVKVKECNEKDKVKECNEKDKVMECNENDKVKECNENDNVKECNENDNVKECNENDEVKECNENDRVEERNEEEIEGEYYEYEYDENGRAYYYDENGVLYYYDEETGESYPENGEEYDESGEMNEEKQGSEAYQEEQESEVYEEEQCMEVENELYEKKESGEGYEEKESGEGYEEKESGEGYEEKESGEGYEESVDEKDIFVEEITLEDDDLEEEEIYDEAITEEPEQIQKDEGKKNIFQVEIRSPDGEEMREEEDEIYVVSTTEEPEQVHQDVEDKKDVFIEEIRSPESDELEEEDEEFEEEEEDDIPCIDLVDNDDIPKETETHCIPHSKLNHTDDEPKETEIFLSKRDLNMVMQDKRDASDEATKISSLLSIEARGLITPTKTELSINTDLNNSISDPFSLLDEEYVKTLTPTLTLHDEEVEEEEFGLQPLISEEELSQKEIPANKPLVLEKLAQIRDEDLNGKSSSNDSFHIDPEDDSDLEELHATFRGEKADSIPSPRTSYEQTMHILRANKVFTEKVKDVEERVFAPILHNKIEQDFQEFLDEDGGQVFVNRITEPASGFKVFTPSKCFSYFHYKHLPYLKHLIFEKSESDVEKLFKNLSCCDLLSSMLIEKGIQELFTSLSEEKSEEFLLFLWKVACCHPDYQIVTKTVEFFKLAYQELPLTWNPSLDLVLETLINFGLNATDNNCPFKPEFEAISSRFSQESNMFKELEENLPSYRMKIINERDPEKLPVNNLAAMLEILSFSVNKSLQLVDTLVLLVWVSMDPQVRAMNLRSKIQKCIENAIHNCPELFLGNYVMDLSIRLIELCEKHDDSLCLVRGLPTIGKARELQKIMSIGVLKRLLNVQDRELKRDDTIEDLVIILQKYKITPKMDCYFLHSIISLIEIFVGNDVSPTQRVPLKLLSQILSKSLAKIADNYINPENSALKLHLFLIKSKWHIVGHAICDEEKKAFTQFACLEAFKN